MSDKGIQEATLSFQLESSQYENVFSQPSYYQALNLQPRFSHPFHCFDGILKQPVLIKQTFTEKNNIIQEIADKIRTHNFSHILLTGIGSSYHIGLSAAHVLSRLSGLRVTAYESSEALLSSLEENFSHSTVVGLSASGNSSETLEHFLYLKDKGAYPISWVNLDNTRLTHAASISYVAPGGFGLGWDFSTRLAALYWLAIELGFQAKIYSQEELEHIKTELFKLPEYFDKLIKQFENHYRILGKLISQCRAAMIIGGGDMLPISLEMALRFEEYAHFPARGRGPVDFLHGGIGFLGNDIVTILLSPNGRTHNYMKRVARVTHTIKSPSIAIVDENENEISSLVDEVIRVPESHPIIKPLLYFVCTQLIAYFTELAHPDGNPDIQRTNIPRYARAFDIALPPKSH